MNILTGLESRKTMPFVRNCCARMFCIFLIAIIFTLSCPLGVSAEDKTFYDLDEIGLTLTIPPDFCALTRGFADDDPSLKRLGADAQEYRKFMNDNDICFYMQRLESYDYMTIRTRPAPEGCLNYDNYSDSALHETADQIKELYEEVDMTCGLDEIYPHNQTKFIKIPYNISKSDLQENGIQYHTAFNGICFYIDFKSNSDFITQEMETEAESIIDTITFKISADSDKYNRSSEINYKDSETGIEFTVPPGWQEEKLTQDDEPFVAKFTNQTGSMVFGHYDNTELLSKMRKRGMARSNMNNSAVTLDEIRKLYETDSTNVSKVTHEVFNDVEYFKILYTPEENDKKYNILYLLIFDGVEYTFIFNGNESSPQYADFQKMMSSVSYDNLKYSYYDNSSTEENKLLNDVIASIDLETILKFILMFDITVVLYIIPILIYRFLIKKSPVDKEKAWIASVVYALIAIVITAIIGILFDSVVHLIAVVLFSLCNYFILRSGSKKESADLSYCYLGEQQKDYTNDNSDSSSWPYMDFSDDEPAFKRMYCHRCGTRLDEDSNVCKVCGEQIDDTNLQ